MTKVRELAYGAPAEAIYDIRLAMEEATRCLLCEDAPCSRDCPAGTDPGRFIRSIRFRNFKGAAQTIREHNILGATCAEICPFDKLCESACSRTGIDKPVSIGKLQAFAMRQEKIFGLRTLTAKAPTGKKVLCIGAGPASLAVAAKLAQNGVEVVVADEHEKPGGILRYGITPSRLSDEIIDQDLNALKDLGVRFEMNKRIDASEIPALKSKYDAIFVGVGLSASKKIPNMPKTDIEGCESALSFLSRARSSGGKLGKLGKVVIIGGGDVAMDCASTSKQLGADSVYVVFLESLENMPANKPELDYVISLGVPVIPCFLPKTVLGDEKVTGVEFESTDKSSSMTLRADRVIFAIGQKATDDYKDVKAQDGVFLAGDIVNGGKTVVQAVADGKVAAANILSYLNIQAD